MINADITPELEELSSDAFNKAKIENNWVVFSKEDIDAFVEHISSTVISDDDLEKAKKDISKLVGKVITDSIGRRKIVWVKRMDTIKQTQPKSGESSGTDEFSDALARHQHNTKVQRMGKEASLKQVGRHFSKEIVDKIREQSELKPPKPVQESTPTEGGSGIEYITAGRNKIDVNQDAIDTIQIATGKASNQADIEAAKSSFVKYMIKTEKYTDKQSVIVFHKYLKTGDNSQIISNGDSGVDTIDMEDILVQACRKSDTPEPKVQRTITDENLDAKISEYTDEMVKKIEKDGTMKVDERWRSGIENNFKVLVEHIDNSDWGSLKEFLTVKYPQWRKFYTEYTGISLPDSDKDTSMFLFRHMHKK